LKIELKYKTIESLDIYSKLLKKDINTIIDEALLQYFENEEKKLLEKNIENDSLMTNLDYDEFWDGVDI
jgi:tRNA A37 N6-isopentenylltransferase MiaA